MSDQTKAAKWVAYATFALVGVTASAVLFTAPALFESRDAVSAVQEGNEIAACRSVYLGDVLDGVTRVLLTQSEGLEAFSTQDLDLLAGSVAQIQVDREFTRGAVVAYEAALQRSNDDPAAFLEECRNG